MWRDQLAPAIGVLALCCVYGCGSDEPGGTGAGTEDGGDGLDTGVPGTGDDLMGRWRIVAYETTGATPLAVTDRNEPVTLPGIGAVVGRVNGLMWIRKDRVAFASALLFDDHVFPDPAILDYDTALQVQGAAAPGRLEQDTFTLSGSSLSYEWSRLPDGTILQLDGAGSLTTWARAENTETTEALLAQGQAAVFRPDEAMPLQQPRLAIAWDLPGGSDVVTSDDEALDIVLGYAWFPLAVGEAPAEAIVEEGDTEIAVAHLIVYDDLDENGVYTAGPDPLRGVSPIGLAYRSPGADEDALSATRYSELLPGWQYVHFHADYSHGGDVGLAPFDPKVFVAPDVLIDVAPREEPIPDVVP